MAYSTPCYASTSDRRSAEPPSPYKAVPAFRVSCIPPELRAEARRLPRNDKDFNSRYPSIVRALAADREGRGGLVLWPQRQQLGGP